MTNEITAAKAEFKLDLVAGGLRVVDFVPERVTPPIVIINMGSPYLTPSTLSHEFTLNLELVCVAATATNKMASEKLDDLIQATIEALPAYSRLISVGQPYNLATNNTEFIAASIQTDVSITI